MNIPLSDLKAQHESIKYELNVAIQNVMESCAFIGGSGNTFVEQFEEAFANYTRIRHCIACANGSDALEIALRALGVGPGDEVIVPARTWIATASAVGMVGASPVFVDSQKGTHNLDPLKLEAAITSKTKAIIVVHLYGQPADIDRIKSVAKQYHLRVVEDCAQAHGAYYKQKHVGCFGDVATFSFFPGKNLGALGDAGAMLTDDLSLAKKLKRFTNHGRLGKEDHVFEGRNSRMDGVQAAVLSVKLKYLDRWVSQRQRLALLYQKLLRGVDLDLPLQLADTIHSYHQFVVEVNDRDNIRQELKNGGIATGVHYSQALPFTQAYNSRGFQEPDYPVAFNQSHRIISLPIYPEMPFAFVEYITEALSALLTPVSL